MSLNGNGDVPHRKWGCVPPTMGDGASPKTRTDFRHRERASSLRIEMYLTGNCNSLQMCIVYTWSAEGLELRG